MLRLLRAGREINVRQGIELVHHDVDVVAADTRAERRDALAFILSGDGVKLPVRRLTLLAVEM